jgi:hypothetical protein
MKCILQNFKLRLSLPDSICVRRRHNRIDIQLLVSVDNSFLEMQDINAGCFIYFVYFELQSIGLNISNKCQTFCN